jgi:hypothetical protein
MIGVIAKTLSNSRPGSTPTIGLPVVFDSTTVLRRAEMSSVALGDGFGHRRQIGNHGTDGQRRAPFIVEGSHHAVILQLELLVEREPRQRTLLNNRKGPEDAAGHRSSQRDRQDQAGRDRSKFEHGKCRSSARGRVRTIPESS